MSNTIKLDAIFSIIRPLYQERKGHCGDVHNQFRFESFELFKWHAMNDRPIVCNCNQKYKNCILKIKRKHGIYKFSALLSYNGYRDISVWIKWNQCDGFWRVVRREFGTYNRRDTGERYFMFNQQSFAGAFAIFRVLQVRREILLEAQRDDNAIGRAFSPKNPLGDLNVLREIVFEWITV